MKPLSPSGGRRHSAAPEKFLPGYARRVPRGRPPKSVDPTVSSSARLGAEIRASRVARGLTLHALARRIGFTPQHISEVELAKTSPSESFVAACDRALSADGRLLELYPAVPDRAAGEARNPFGLPSRADTLRAGSR